MALPIPKPPQKPIAAPKPGLFTGGRQPSVKEFIREAKKDLVIPGTGGQIMPKTQLEKFLKQRLPYEKVKTNLDQYEAKNILRKMRVEDRGNPSRERRILEEKFGLKGKY